MHANLTPDVATVERYDVYPIAATICRELGGRLHEMAGVLDVMGRGEWVDEGESDPVAGWECSARIARELSAELAPMLRFIDVL